MDVAKQCPHCARWCLKDAACNYIFACGLGDGQQFAGCGRPFCWECGKKFCGQYADESGNVLAGARSSHGDCCRGAPDFKQEDYCAGGHNSHCERRW